MLLFLFLIIGIHVELSFAPIITSWIDVMHIPITNKRTSDIQVVLEDSLVCKTSENFVMNCGNTGSCSATYTDMNFLDGYSAPILKGMKFGYENLIRSILQELFESERVCS